MVLSHVCMNYEIKSLNYKWQSLFSGPIMYKPLSDIMLEDFKDFLRTIKPYEVNYLWESLKYIKGIDSKYQIKYMIKSKDLLCTIECIYLDTDELNKQKEIWEPFDTFIPLCKNWVLDYNKRKYFLYEDNSMQMYDGFSHLFADYRINLNNTHLDHKIGDVVAFEYNGEILKGVIVSIHNESYKEVISYVVALPNTINGKYEVLFDEDGIAADDIVIDYHTTNYQIVKEVVLNDKIYKGLLFSDAHKEYVKKLLG